MSKLAVFGGQPVRTKPLHSWPCWDDKEEKALLEVLHSGKWWFGEKVEEFEARYAAWQGAGYGVACSTGTAALQIAVRALGIGFGDEVITTPLTFIATSTAVITAGAVPVYIDVEEDTMNLDLDKVEAAVTPKTKAILPVHVFGRPLDMDRLTALAEKHGLLVIEDAAHCWGGRWKDKGLGCIGRAGIFSFQVSKNITCSEGGILLTNDEPTSIQAWSFMNCGRWPGKPWYHMENISPNMRMTEFQAALLLAQMSRADEQIERRIRTHDCLYEKLQGRAYIRTLAPDVPESTRRSHHGMFLRYIAEEWDGVSKDQFLKAMNAEGILIGGGYGFPLYKEPALMDRGKLPPGDYPDYGSMFLPNAEKLSREGILLPQQSLLAAPEEALDVVRAVDKIWENRAELGKLPV